MDTNMIPLLFLLIGCACNLIGIHIGNKFSDRLRMPSVETHELKFDLVYREMYIMFGSVFLFLGNYLPNDTGMLQHIACFFFAAIGLYQVKNLMFWLRMPVEALQKSRDLRMPKPEQQDK